MPGVALVAGKGVQRRGGATSRSKVRLKLSEDWYDAGLVVGGLQYQDLQLIKENEAKISGCSVTNRPRVFPVVTNKDDKQRS